MRPAFRPPLEANGVQVGGVWLYADGGDYPILHIIDRKPEDGPTGAFNHFAFRGTGLLAFLDHLRAHAVDFKAAPVADTADTQVHFFDPNGVKIDRKSVVSGKSVSVRVDRGGRRIIKKKKKNNNII